MSISKTGKSPNITPSPFKSPVIYYFLEEVLLLILPVIMPLVPSEMLR